MTGVPPFVALQVDRVELVLPVSGAPVSLNRPKTVSWSAR